MILNRVHLSFLALLLAGSISGVAQNPPPAQDSTPTAVSPAPEKDQQPDAASQEQSSAPGQTAQPSAPKQPDQAAAYYHYALAHMYEEMVSMYGRSDYANKAIDEYRLAIENDPNSDYLNAALAELYARTGRIRDAVLEAQDILKRDGNNLEAHRLLGR